jgi:hypothetical protein
MSPPKRLRADRAQQVVSAVSSPAVAVDLALVKITAWYRPRLDASSFDHWVSNRPRGCAIE